MDIQGPVHDNNCTDPVLALDQQVNDIAVQKIFVLVKEIVYLMDNMLVISKLKYTKDNTETSAYIAHRQLCVLVHMCIHSSILERHKNDIYFRYSTRQ